MISGNVSRVQEVISGGESGGKGGVCICQRVWGLGRTLETLSKVNFYAET